MNDDPLIVEFNQINAEYEAMRREFDAATAPLLKRRRDIVRKLVVNVGAVRPRTYRQVGQMLHLSATRVGQLDREAIKHEQSGPTAS